MEAINPSQGIEFGSNGNYLKYCRKGWSVHPEDGMCWNDGNIVELEFRSPTWKRDPTLTVRGAPYIHQDLIPKQHATVFLNGLWISFFSATESIVHVSEVPRDYFSSRGNILSFLLPFAATPQSLGVSDDRRLLAFAFFKISVSDADARTM